MVVYLIVAHGFEVDEGFKPEKVSYPADADYAFDPNPQKLHKTMEVLASAITGQPLLDYLKCHTVVDWAKKGGRWTTRFGGANPSEELANQILSGNLRNFVTERIENDERLGEIPTAHSVRMLNSIYKNIDAIEATYKAKAASSRQAEQGEDGFKGKVR